MEKTENNQVDHSSRGHTKISPSGLKNFALCPGYVNDTESSPHPLTLRGTAMHEAMETGDDSNLLDDEERHLVAVARGHVQNVRLHHDVLEPQLDIIPGMKGHCDFVSFDEKEEHAVAIDYKFGFHPVDDAEHNLQAWGYVLGIFKKWPTLMSLDFHFVQPRIMEISYHSFFRFPCVPKIDNRIREIVSTVENLENADGTIDVEKLNPSCAACQYCARMNCPALAVKGYEIAKNYSEDDLQLPEEFHPSQITDPNQMAKALKLAPVLEKWAKSVRKHANDMRIQQGVEVPGYELVHKKGKRSIVHAQSAWEVASKMGVTEEEFMQCATISITALEDAVAEHAEPRGKAKSKAKLFDDLEDLDAVTYGADAAYLAPIRTKKQNTK